MSKTNNTIKSNKNQYHHLTDKDRASREINHMLHFFYKSPLLLIYYT